MKKRSLAFVFAMLMIVSTFSSSTMAADAMSGAVPTEDTIVYHGDGIYEVPADENSFNDSSETNEIFELTGEIFEVPASVELEFDPSQAIPGIADDLLRGKDKPTQEYNINGKDYHVDGTFKVSIYTSYYFSPTASGNLSYKFTVDWNQYSTIQKQATLYLIDKTTNTEKQLRTFSMTERPDGMYGTSATTGGWTLGGLNPDHDYYFRITKTTDGIEADLSGVISSEWW